MKLTNFKLNSRFLYWGLIYTFIALYICVGFVSTLHSITFFGLANTLGLAILLGVTYEIGQSAVLFSILMTKNKNTYLPWILMFLLTALQVTANVYASFKFIATSGSNDWQFWQKSILFGVQASSPEMYQMIISWIAGALLPIVALGMTALVAQNMHFITQESTEEDTNKVGTIPDEEVDKIINDEIDKRLATIIDTAKVADLEKPSELVIPIEQIKPLGDFDESGIGGEPTKEQENLISDFINKNKTDYIDDSSAYLGEEAARFTPLIDEVNEKSIKKQKPGRPPKQKEKVVEPKKEKGLLLKEEKVKVPQKEQKSITIDPLKTKSTTQVVTNLEEVIKPSKGDEVIKLIENLDKVKTEESITQAVINDQRSPDASEIPLEFRTPYLDGGVEVIDAKAISKAESVKKN